MSQETALHALLEDIETRIRAHTTTADDTITLANVLRAGLDEYLYTATETDNWDRAMGASDIYNAMHKAHKEGT